jgi:drug/metabolite transporter (DMT)-like permease
MGLFFACLSPALNSVTNYIDKFLLDKYHVPPVLLALYSGIVAFIASIAIFVFIQPALLDFNTTLIILLSGVLTILQIIPYFKALSFEEASRVVPLFQLIPIIVLILSYFMLGEELTTKQYLGATFIVGASFYLSIEKGKGLIKVRKAFWYMLIASFFSALSLVLFKLGVEEVDFWSALLYEGVGILIGAVLLMVFLYRKQNKGKKNTRSPKKIFVFAAFNEVIYLSSRYSSFFALNFISATLVSVLSGLQPVFVLLFGIVLTKWFPQVTQEVIDKKTISLKLACIVAILIGLVLIFL